MPGPLADSVGETRRWRPHKWGGTMRDMGRARPPDTGPRKRLRLSGFGYGPGYVYSVTVRASKERRPFTNARVANDTVSHLRRLDEQGKARVHCFCLMPDHLHLVLSCPRRGGSLSEVMREFKSLTTRAARALGVTGPLWQRGFYDHIARSEEDLRAACEYILNNPVRAGLAADPHEWPYSGMLSPLPL